MNFSALYKSCITFLRCGCWLLDSHCLESNKNAPDCWANCGVHGSWWYQQLSDHFQFQSISNPVLCSLPQLVSVPFKSTTCSSWKLLIFCATSDDTTLIEMLNTQKLIITRLEKLKEKLKAQQGIKCMIMILLSNVFKHKTTTLEPHTYI